MKIHHAPWSKKFRTHWYKGTYAYEIQIGPMVIQWFYEPWDRATLFKRLNIWKDRYWR